MQLLAAAQAEELRAQAATLAPEMERHQVPVEYLAGPELARALKTAHSAETPTAVEVAEAAVKKRLFLIGKDGIHGLDIDQLRKEATAKVSGAGGSHFKDAEFVKTAKDMDAAKLLAEGGFTGSRIRVGITWAAKRTRREGPLRPLEGLGREIENRVAGDDSSRLKDQGLKSERSRLRPWRGRS